VIVVVVVVVIVIVIVIVIMRARVVAIMIGEEVRIDLVDAIEIECAEVQNRVERDVAARHFVEPGGGVHRAQGALDFGEFVLADQVGLVQQDHISKGNLLGGFLGSL
jgi:hypothetical protein